MVHKSREEAISHGIDVAPTKHRQTRRASWKNYWMSGVYGITIHIREGKDGKVGKAMLLSEIAGNSSLKPQEGEYATHASGTTPAMRPGHMATPAKGLGYMEPEQAGAAAMRPEHMATPARGLGYMEPEQAGAAAMRPGQAGAAVGPLLPCAQTSLSEQAPRPRLTALGRIVDRKIREIGTHLHEESVTVTHHVVMPTHIHMIVRVNATLPWHNWHGTQRRWTLSDIIKGFEKGCTSWYYRMIEGESIDEIFANPTRRRASKEPPMVEIEGKMQPIAGIWNGNGFNDKILMTEERHALWLRYLCNNAYYWKLQKDYPQLFEHVQHLTLGGIDYSAYGCMFLLGRTDRKQVMCHRLARRGMLTEREWQLATQSMQVIRAYEADARKNKLGHFDWNWYSSNDPTCITPIDYTRTESFRNQKAELLRACEEDEAVLISPAISKGERMIVEEALELGYPVIKLVRKPIGEKAHALDKDRDYCAKAQMLVLGPWEIRDYSGKEAGAHGSRYGGAVPSDTLYADFHNLNGMAERLCTGVAEFDIDITELEKCK